MLIDTSLTITYKCPSCGSFKFFNVSIFEAFYKKEYSLKCDCNMSHIGVTVNRKGKVVFEVPCIGCGSNHRIALDKNDLWQTKVKAYKCPFTGIYQFFIGKDEAVRKSIDKVEREYDNLMDMFGYDSYFTNTQVVLDSLNKIHDLAEQGNLRCECGNNDIELSLLSDKIYLKCRRCSASRIIYTISNEHLKDILMRQQILLYKGINRL